MTLLEFQQIFQSVQAAIVDIIKSNVDVGQTKVYDRDVFDENQATWLGRLTAADGSTHCWSVFYTGCPALADAQVPTATEIFVPTFRIVGYRGYNFGTDADNSSRRHTDEVNQLRWAFMQDPQLALTDYVSQHTGFIDRTVLGKIDTKPVHITRVDLGVELLPIDYNYPA